MLKWSVSSVSDKRPVVAEKSERKYSYDGSVADSSTSDTEHGSDLVINTNHVTGIVLPEFKPRKFIVSNMACV